MTVGGYLLFMHMSVASMAPANQVDVAMRASAEIAAGSPAGSSDTTGKSASLAKHESAGSPGPALTPSAAVPQPIVESVPAANVGPPLDRTAGARSLRARRVSADRKRDPNGGNIFHYLREFGRAFADIEPAKRVEKPGRTKSSPATAGKQRVDQARIASSVPSVSRQRTAAQDPSREEGPAMVRMP